MIYKDKNAAIEDRVEDLISRMTLVEKVQQLKSNMSINVLGLNGLNKDKVQEMCKDGIGRFAQFSMQPGATPKQIGQIYNFLQKYFIENTRLGIPVLTQVECMSGLVAQYATSFPCPLCVGSTFSEEYAQAIGQTIKTEMRALGCHFGLAPVVDIARDARWGRNYESYGEDSYLAAILGLNVVKGMQGENLNENVAACAKHFLAYSIPKGGLNTSSVEIGEKELIEVHATPYEAMIQEAGLQGIMCTYSAINGVPMSISEKYLTGLLRNRLGFDGTAVCDGSSITRVYEKQHATRSLKSAGIKALEAGLCSDAPVAKAFNSLVEATENGELNEEYIDIAVKQVLKQKFELGLFDNPYINVDNIEAVLNEPAADALSKEICDNSMVLLKNDGILPLKKGKKIAIIGPFANNLKNLFAGYTYPSSLEMFQGMIMGRMGGMTGVTDEMRIEDGINVEKLPLLIKRLAKGAMTKTDVIEEILREEYVGRTLFEAMADEYDGEVNFAEGCDFLEINEEKMSIAIELAKQSDLVILTGGEKCGWSPDATSGEGKDKATITMPLALETLIERVMQVNENVILTLTNGRPLALSESALKSRAIIETWCPGNFGGDSLTDIMLGRVNPSGKLTVTIPRSEGQIPIHYNHKTGEGYCNKKDDAKRGLEAMFGGGYVDMPSTPLFYFGDGITYTNFEYSNLVIKNKKVDTDSAVELVFTLKNTGEREGTEIAQIYFGSRGLTQVRPIRQLVGFKRITLKPGEEKVVSCIIDLSKIAYLDDDFNWCLCAHDLTVEVGASSNGCTLVETIEITGDITKYTKRNFANNITFN